MRGDAETNMHPGADAACSSVDRTGSRPAQREETPGRDETLMVDGVRRSATSEVQAGAKGKSRCGVLEYLHRDHSARVVQEFRRTTKNFHEAQDLAQETFLKVCEAIVRGCVREPVGYLWTAVRNRAQNWIRDSGG